MKLNLTYGASFELIITTVHGNFTHEMKSCTLQDAVDYCEMIFDDGTPIRSRSISKITVCDSFTGEICAECERDDAPTDSEIDNPNYDPDWGFNEDEGFDPYLGCYTEDC